MLAPLGLREYQDFKKGSDKTWNLHDFRYDAWTGINRGLRNRVIHLRKSLYKDSTLDQEII